MFQPDSIKVRISKEEISQRIKALASEINAYYGDQEILMVCILKGAFMFLADLIRELSMPLTVDFMVVSSYGDETETSGEVRVLKDLQKSIKNQHVLIVEDIVDTGLTLNHILKFLGTREPAELKVCTFLNKPVARKVDIRPDFWAFEVGQEFVVGYGLDYAQHYRQLPFIGVMTEG
ncbi:MAG: hypoxanthine phosphoribosyltransferase [Candidatus Wallbacteria bacterium]|nr:hypoxanthine phosphoribosyltransferase [Candidatus Wallbacteria bacterium]